MQDAGLLFCTPFGKERAQREGRATLEDVARRKELPVMLAAYAVRMTWSPAETVDPASTMACSWG
jgi:hypothetical protein